MFTLNDYKAALKGAGPKLTENILWRAAHDANIGFMEYKELADLAYPAASWRPAATASLQRRTSLRKEARQ